MTCDARQSSSSISRNRSTGRLVLVLALIISCAALLSVRSAASQSTTSKPRPSQSAKPASAQALTMIDLAGYNKLLADHKGKPLLVTFWATWCEPCRDEYPLVNQIAKDYASKGLVVLGVDMDDDSAVN